MSSHTIGPYEALGFRFDVTCAHDGIRSTLARTLRPLSTEAPAHRHYEVEWDTAAEQFTTALDGRSVGSSPGMRLVVEELVWHVNRCATDAWSGILLHGGAVCDEAGRAVILVGSSGSGKSTLTAGLVDDGFGYLTDELIAARVGSDELHAYPRAITLKHGSRPIVPHLDPGRPGPGEPALSMWFVDPRRIRSDAVVSTATVDSIVLLEPTGPEAPLHVSAPSPAETLVDLVEETFGLGAVDQAGLETLADWCRRLPSVRIRGGTHTERVQSITDRLKMR